MSKSCNAPHKKPLFPHFDWKEPKPIDSTQRDDISKEFNISYPIASILLRRPFLQDLKVSQVDLNNEIKYFLYPALSNLASPDGLAGIPQATELIWNAILKKEKIIVFGDFDADGICATSILVGILTDLHAQVFPFIPERLTEGYGLTRTALNRCFQMYEKPDLLITVDCGINSIDEVEYLKSEGIQVIITDHHTPGDILPKAECVIDSVFSNTDKPLKNLCGAGVAFKLVQSLVDMGKEKGWFPKEKKVIKKILAEAAIATIADVVPLVGENRILVSEALDHWRNFTPLGIQALLRETLSQSIDKLSEEQVSFLIAPHINASGRMGSARTAYDLLTATTPDQAKELAVKLKDLNIQRKQTENRVSQAAVEQLGLKRGENPLDMEQSLPEAIVVSGPKNGPCPWHPGVIGIVASRLANCFGRPAAVISMNGDDPSQAAGHGSIRTATGYNVKVALDDCSSVLSAYGGHPGAAGFSIKPGCLEQFKELLCQACARQRSAIQVTAAALQIDYWLSPEEITLTLYDQARRLGPFGSANPKIHWGLHHVCLNDVSILGANNIQYNRPTHLSLSFAKENVLLPQAIWFRQGDKEKYFKKQIEEGYPYFDIAFELSKNEFGSTPTIEMIITDIRPSETQD